MQQTLLPKVKEILVSYTVLNGLRLMMECLVQHASLSQTSNLLKETQAFKHSSWESLKQRETSPVKVEAITVTEARKLSLESGPKNVHSRLLEPTVAISSSKWKSKEELEAEDIARAELELSKVKKIWGGSDLKVKEVSARILMPTACFESSKFSRTGGASPPAATAAELTEARKLSLESGPQNVSSRLFETTAAMSSSKWRTKEELARAEQVSLNSLPS